MHLPMQETEETQVPLLDRDDPLEEDVANHSSILAWRIPWIEEPGGLQSMGSQRAGCNQSDLACTHDVPFSSCLQSFPASGSFPMNWLFVSGGQSIGASASASVLTHTHRSRSVVSDSLRPHGLQPTRLLGPRDFPGMNTGGGCRFLLRISPQYTFINHGINGDSLHYIRILECEKSHLLQERLGDFHSLTEVDALFFWAPTSLQMVNAVMKLKDTCSLVEKL